MGKQLRHYKKEKLDVILRDISPELRPVFDNLTVGQSRKVGSLGRGEEGRKAEC